MNPIAWLHHWLLPDWTRDESPDHRHPHKRRFTPAYLRKKGIVKNLWIASGLIVIILPAPAVVLAVAMGTTFLSFMILDESA